MAFSMIDQIDVLNGVAKSLVKLGTDISKIQAVMAEDVAKFEKDTGHKLCFKKDCTNGNWFSIAMPNKKDYASTKKPYAVRMISARINNVIISANFYKPGVYDHSNSHVAQALRILADKIEKSPVRLADHDYKLI